MAQGQFPKIFVAREIALVAQGEGERGKEAEAAAAIGGRSLAVARMGGNAN